MEVPGSPDRSNTPQPSPSVRFNDRIPSPRPFDLSFTTLPPSGRFSDLPPNIRYNESIDPNMRLASMVYKRRPTTPTRRRFEMGELDNNEVNANSRSSRYNPAVEQEEIALKDELLRIFNREKDAMEQHYLLKIQELLRSFKSKKEEWENMVKEEREDLEKQFDQERSEIHQNFAQEIARMTRSFQEDKSENDRKNDIRLKDREMELDREKRDLNDSWRNQIDNIKRQCLTEHEATLNIELKNENEKHRIELENLINKHNSVKYDLEQKTEREKERLEKKYENDVNNVENKFQKHLFDTEKRFEEEKIRLNKKFDEEKGILEKDWQRRLETLESALRKETNLRIETEKVAAGEKANFQALNNMLKEEISRLKEEIDRLRKQPTPPPEVKIIEKPVPFEKPEKPYSSRSDLPLTLRDDFDRIVNDYKENLKDKFNRDKNSMEEKLENEKERLKQKISKEKEELDKRLNEEKTRMERDMDRSRDDIEKEIERRLRTKQLSESLSVQQQKFDEVTRRIEEEERKRVEKLLDNDNKKLDSILNDLSRENEGLKAKVEALEDNNNVLKNLKEEGQQEVERLRRAVEDLKNVVEMRRENERARETPLNTTTDYAPFLMTMMHQNQQQRPLDDVEQPIAKAHMDALSVERRKLEALRNELEKQEREMRDRKCMEDAAKIAIDKSQEKYENLVYEKKKLEDTLQALESKVGNMQEEFTKIKSDQQASQAPYPHSGMPQPYLPPGPPIVLQGGAPLNISMTDRNDPNMVTVSSPAPQTTSFHNGIPYPYYPHQVVFSPNDQSEKIDKLKATKDRLTEQLEQLQHDLKEANFENSALQKQCREYEKQIDRLNDSLEREKELSQELKRLAQDEKVHNDRLKEDLQREMERVHHLQSEMNDVRDKMENEINDLQEKLHHAGQTIVAVRQQATEEINAAASMIPTSIVASEKQHQTLNNRPPTPSSLYANNAAKRRLSFSKADGLPPLDRTSVQTTNMKDGKEIPRAIDIVMIKSLEEDKHKLQQQLNEAKGCLDNFTGKISNKIDNLENKYESTKSQTHELSEENRSLNEALAAMELEQSNQARQNFQLRQQKEHLQKLIERLTNINPAQSQPTQNYRYLPSTRTGGSEYSNKDYPSPPRREYPANAY